MRYCTNQIADIEARLPDPAAFLPGSTERRGLILIRDYLLKTKAQILLLESLGVDL